MAIDFLRPIIQATATGVVFGSLHHHGIGPWHQKIATLNIFQSISCFGSGITGIKALTFLTGITSVDCLPLPAWMKVAGKSAAVGFSLFTACNLMMKRRFKWSNAGLVFAALSGFQAAQLAARELPGHLALGFIHSVVIDQIFNQAPLPRFD